MADKTRKPGRPKGTTKASKQPTVSGTGYTAKPPLKYARRSADGQHWEIDTDTINSIIQAYIEDNKDRTLSRQGLRIALDIGRDTYNTWLRGYTKPEHQTDETLTINTVLADSMRAGDDRIMQYLVETCDKYGDSKRIRLLETYGEIAPAKQAVSVDMTLTPNNVLGSLRKYAK